MNPSRSIPYQADLVTAGALLHAVGIAKKYTPSPDMRRIPESVPLSRYELTMIHGYHGTDHTEKEADGVPCAGGFNWKFRNGGIPGAV